MNNQFERIPAHRMNTYTKAALETLGPLSGLICFVLLSFLARSTKSLSKVNELIRIPSSQAVRGHRKKRFMYLFGDY